MSGNVLVFIERRAGEIKRPSLEALGVARRLADRRGALVHAPALGPGAAGCAASVAAHGADTLIALEAEHAELYAPELYARCLADAARETEASIVLCAATTMGKDLAPRATACLGSACASDLVEVEVDDKGTLHGRRPVYSGKAFVRVSMAGAVPALATLRPNVFPLVEPDASRRAKVRTIEAPLSPDALGVRVVRLEQPERQEADVGEASIVVSGGRGLKEAASFSLIRELAEVLDIEDPYLSANVAIVQARLKVTETVFREMVAPIIRGGISGITAQEYRQREDSHLSNAIDVLMADAVQNHDFLDIANSARMDIAWLSKDMQRMVDFCINNSLNMTTRYSPDRLFEVTDDGSVIAPNYSFRTTSNIFIRPKAREHDNWGPNQMPGKVPYFIPVCIDGRLMAVLINAPRVTMEEIHR